MNTIDELRFRSILSRNEGSDENMLANQGRTFQHLNNIRQISGIQYSDEDVAHMTRMLMRDDLMHEDVVCMARDRILCLVEENKALKTLLKDTLTGEAK